MGIKFWAFFKIYELHMNQDIHEMQNRRSFY